MTEKPMNQICDATHESAGEVLNCVLLSGHSGIHYSGRVSWTDWMPSPLLAGPAAPQTPREACSGPYVKPCIEYADDLEHLRLYQWCMPCLIAFADLLRSRASSHSPSANEGELFKRLSDVLTGGNAGTWDEVIHAAESRPSPSAALRELEKYEELEARLCPEDVGFEEWIGVLVKRETKLTGALEEQTAALRALVDQWRHHANKLRQLNSSSGANTIPTMCAFDKCANDIAALLPRPGGSTESP